VVPEISSRTDRHTDVLITILRAPSGGSNYKNQTSKIHTVTKTKLFITIIHNKKEAGRWTITSRGVGLLRNVVYLFSFLHVFSRFKNGQSELAANYPTTVRFVPQIMGS